MNTTRMRGMTAAEMIGEREDWEVPELEAAPTTPEVEEEKKSAAE